MKWQIYKNMTDAQRMYWHFNFNDKKPQLSLDNFISPVNSFMYLTIFFIMFIYVGKTININTMPFYNAIIYLFSYGGFIIFFYLIIAIFENGLHLYKEHKWLKSEKII